MYNTRIYSVYKHKNNKYHNYQYSNLDKEKKLYYVKLSHVLHELPISLKF